MLAVRFRQATSSASSPSLRLPDRQWPMTRNEYVMVADAAFAVTVGETSLFRLIKLAPGRRRFGHIRALKTIAWPLQDGHSCYLVC